MATNNNNGKSLESWIWDAACSIRGAKDAPKYKEFILPLIFAKRLCDVFDDELDRIAKEVGSRAKAFKLVKHDKKLVRFFLPRIVGRDEIAKNDFNISPSRYIHTGQADEYRPIAEILEELEGLEESAVAGDLCLKAVLKKLTVPA